MNEQIKELYHKAHDNWDFGKRPVGDIIREQLGDK
jgi:hypothetical protein